MDFTLPTKDHRAAIDAAAEALPAKVGALPSLAFVRIEARADGTITYSGTDLDFGIGVEVVGTVTRPGAVCLPGAKLAEIAKNSDPESTTRINASAEIATIEAGTSRFRLHGGAADLYAGGPQASWDAPLLMPIEILAEMADHVAWAASTDPARPVLNGVLIETNKGNVRMVATDGKQLALSEVSLTGATGEHARISPPRLLEAAAKLLKGHGPVEIALTDRTIAFRAAGITLAAHTLEGPYANYKAVLPKSATRTAHVPTSALRRAVLRVGTIAKGIKHKPIAADIGDGKIRLWTESPDLGLGSDHLVAQTTGDPIRIAFNADVVDRVLQHVPTEETRLRLSEADKAILVDGRGGKSPVRSLWIAMPVRLELLPWAGGNALVTEDNASAPANTTPEPAVPDESEALATAAV